MMGRSLKFSLIYCCTTSSGIGECCGSGGVPSATGITLTSLADVDRAFTSVTATDICIVWACSFCLVSSPICCDSVATCKARASDLDSSVGPDSACGDSVEADPSDNVSRTTPNVRCSEARLSCWICCPYANTSAANHTSQSDQQTMKDRARRK